MGTDYTLADLAEDSGIAAGAGGSDGGSSSGGEWVNELFDKLDEKGYLDQLIASQIKKSKPQQSGQDAPGYESVTPQESAGGSQGGFNSEQLRSLMLTLYDHSDQIPGVSEDPKLSELIQLVESQPEIANQMIEEHL